MDNVSAACAVFEGEKVVSSNCIEGSRVRGLCRAALAFTDA